MKNPFGEQPPSPPARVNPFGDDPDEALPPAEAAARVTDAARKIRGLRTQLGSEGLTLQGTRQLIDEVASALEAAARALRGLG